MSPNLHINALSGAANLQFSFLDNHPLASFIIGTDQFGIIYANQVALSILDITEKEIISSSFIDLLEDQSRIEFINTCVKRPAQINIRSGLQKKNKSILVVDLYASLIIISDKDFYQVSAVDVTETVRLEENLQEDKKRYQTYIEQSSEGIFCQDMKNPVPVNLPFDEFIQRSRSNSFISECNDAMAKMYGYETADELKGILAEQLIDFSNPANLEYFKNFIDNGFRVVSAESCEWDRYGETRYFLNNAIGIIENGCLSRVWGTQKDITNEKKTQKELRLLANLVEQTSDVLTAADLDFRPLSWNRAAEKIYGLKTEEVLGRDIRDLLEINYHHATRDEVRSMISSKGEWRGEASFIRPTDRKMITLLMSFKQLKNEKCELQGYLISATDISERKEAESRLSESENRFREMADSSPVMIWMTDEYNITSYNNRKWIEFTGKDITGEPEGWSGLLHPFDLPTATKTYQSAFEKKDPVTLIYRLRRSDGTYRWVQDVSVPRFLHDGYFIGYIGSLIDIEDQKSKQEQLLYHAMILDNVSDVVVTTDLEFRVKVWNKIAEAYYGISESEALGRRMEDLIEFAYNKYSREEARNDLKTKGIWRGEVSFINKLSEKKYFLHTVKYVQDEHGENIGFLSTGKDITARKEVEEKLARSEQFYRALIADSLDGMILLDTSGKITFCSPSVKNVLGFEVDEVVGKNGFEFVHPDDISWAFESFQKEVVENPEIKFITVRLRKKSGEWLWCMVRGHNMLRNPSINSIVIYFHDDSLRKQASDALKESEKRFRNLIRDLQIGIIIQDKEGRTLLCNDSFAEIFGSTQENLLGIRIEDIAIDPIHEDGRKFIQEERPTFKAVQSKKLTRDVVMGITRPNLKHRIWVLINADPVLDDQGEVTQVICSVKDITERKRMEGDQMAKQIRHQRQLTQASLDGQEKERREIGKELHDNIGQQLTTIKLFLDLAKSTADDNTNEMVSMALKGVSDMINEVRAMSRSLVPSTLKDLGLSESINELIESIVRTQLMKIEFEDNDFDEASLQENQKLTLFRIIQEQLNNIVKHSGARNVLIEISNQEKKLMLKIRDDGAGFDPKKVRKGLGFMNIKNRAELFQGHAEIISKPGEGCLLKVSMPFNLSGVTVS